MLSGDNGLLNRTIEARERTIHANVFEQLQLEELAHLTDKSTSRDTSTLCPPIHKITVNDAKRVFPPFGGNTRFAP